MAGQLPLTDMAMDDADGLGFTELQEAAGDGCTERVQLLLESGAAVDARPAGAGQPTLCSLQPYWATLQSCSCCWLHTHQLMLLMTRV